MMNRRNFLKTSAIAGTTVGAFAGLQSCSDAREGVQIEPSATPIALSQTENSFLKVDVLSNGQLVISDKINGEKWTTSAVAMQEREPIEQHANWQRAERTFMEQYPARFEGRTDGNSYRFTMYGRQNRVKGQFSFRINLEDKYLRFTLTEVSHNLHSLVYPGPVMGQKSLIPHHIGRMVHHQSANIWYRQFLPFHTHLNMRWIGGLKGNAGWLAIFDDESADAGAMAVNNTVAPCWLPSLGKWKGHYSLLYGFVKGSYVEVAKAYRQHLIDTGRFRTLADKIIENPHLANMIGGRTLSYFQAWPSFRPKNADDYLFTDEQRLKQTCTKGVTVDFTHTEVQKSLAYAQNKGFSRGMIMLRGWINGGYDASHPDIWPPEPLLGTEAELKALMQYPGNYITALHDNYQDMYPHVASFPKGINQMPDGELMPGGLWAGGQSYMLNSRDSLAYAKRNWEKVKALHPKAYFSDTVTASKLHQSFERGNEQTRWQDFGCKRQLLQYFKQQGMLTGSEEGADFCAATCDWFENRHHRTPGETVPLFQLVFHDSVVSSRYNSFDPSFAYPGWLEDMLWGYQLQFFMTPEFGGIRSGGGSEKTGFGANTMNETLFTSTYHVDEWHARIGASEW